VNSKPVTASKLVGLVQAVILMMTLLLLGISSLFSVIVTVSYVPPGYYLYLAEIVEPDLLIAA
jgi:hypothetical protein